MYESRCGLLCSQCPNKEDFGCEGCSNMPEGYWGGACEIKICCEIKKFEHCGRCPDFPCKILKDISYDTETGDDGERLMRCKEWVDKAADNRWSFYRKILIGISIGIILGFIIGIIQEMLTAWLIAGLAVGAGIGFMLHIGRKK